MPHQLLCRLTKCVTFYIFSILKLQFHFCHICVILLLLSEINCFCLVFWRKTDVDQLFKACIHFFINFFFIFSSNDRPSKTMKYFLFHLKSSFRSRNIQIFIIFSLPFRTFQIQKGKCKWTNLWYHKLACINLQM